MDRDYQELLFQYVLDKLAQGQFCDAREHLAKLVEFGISDPDGIYFVLEETGEVLAGWTEAVRAATEGQRVLIQRRSVEAKT